MNRPVMPALVTIAALVSTLALSACDSPKDDSSGRLPVVATTTQVADFARNIGGENVTVTQILKPNIDPHDYEPSPADTKAIGEAQLVLKNGVGLETWLNSSIKASGFHGRTVDTSKGIVIRRGEGSNEEKAGDPHIWHNPLNAKVMAANIENALAEVDKKKSKTFHRNYTAYAKKLDDLDAHIASAIATIPASQRKLVTNHDAFGYYIDHYHLQLVGSVIPSFDTSAELSSKDIDILVRKIQSTGVRAIFSESSLPAKAASTIASEAHVRVEAGSDSLYGDTLGPPGSAGSTYLKMEEHNTATIVRALA